MAVEARWKRAPKGYYGPRLAVGAASMVGAVALYEVVNQAIRRATALPPRDYGIWEASWDEAAGSGGEQPAGGEPAASAMLLARQTREASQSSAQVERRHLIFVRHAQAGGGGNTPSQQADSPLSEAGRKQAELTGKRLRDLFDEEVTTVYHSGSAEAQATAEVLQRVLAKGKGTRGGPQVVESTLLAEGLPTIPSPSSLSPDQLDQISEEELALDAARAEGAFKAHIWSPSGGAEAEGLAAVEVLVGHGNVIRYLTCRALQLPGTAWSRLAASHCSLTWLDIDCGGAVILHEFGATGHLPTDLLTYH